MTPAIRDGRSLHLEAAQLLGLDLVDVDAVDLGAGWTDAGEVDHDLDVVGVALEPRLDGAVVVVAHPAGDAGAVGAATDRLAEEHALDVPVDDDAPGDGHGASAPSTGSAGGAVAACTSAAISSRCARTRSLMSPTISDALSICVLAPVSCWRTRRTFSSSPTARSTVSETAAPSIPSPSPRPMTTRARASE